MEPEFWQLVPPGVSVHTTRVPTERAGTPEALREMEAASLSAAAEVAKGEPGVVVWGDVHPRNPGPDPLRPSRDTRRSLC